MSLIDLIMQQSQAETFTKEDWQKLGRGEISDQSVIDRMLEEGYEAVVDND